ncbi:MAG: zinc ribbon domain-containing protein [Verrucomicrobiota bacterium]|nr:zinc ribbon domain-containing protein [Verrucomicrobiota bacterium]
MKRPPETCPNCGTSVPRRALACPACGADHETGWSEAAEDSNTDLPDEEFNYNEYVQREFGGGSPVPKGLHWFWWLVGVLLVAGLLFGLLGR